MTSSAYLGAKRIQIQVWRRIDLEAYLAQRQEPVRLATQLQRLAYRSFDRRDIGD